MHILRMYVYIDAPIILGVLYMYECMHVCMYYVCMYVCTPINAPFGAPIANRRADRRPVCCRCVCPKLNMHVLRMYVYIDAPIILGVLNICMNACMYVCIMYVCVFVLQSARHSALRWLIGALIGALCAVDVSQVKYARIENVYIYRRAD